LKPTGSAPFTSHNYFSVDFAPKWEQVALQSAVMADFGNSWKSEMDRPTGYESARAMPPLLVAALVPKSYEDRQREHQELQAKIDQIMLREAGVGWGTGVFVSLAGTLKRLEHGAFVETPHELRSIAHDVARPSERTQSATFRALEGHGYLRNAGVTLASQVYTIAQLDKVNAGYQYYKDPSYENGKRLQDAGAAATVELGSALVLVVAKRRVQTGTRGLASFADDVTPSGYYRGSKSALNYDCRDSGLSGGVLTELS
jgi:hypothetical protein